MRIHWAPTYLLLGLTVVVLGCGGYSAPNNPPAQDSTRDSTAQPPAYNQ